MRRHAVILILSILIAGAFPALGIASAEDPADIYLVELSPGQDFEVCLSGEILCPARFPICDDLSVATIVDLPSGLGFRGVAKGTTLCSAVSTTRMRRVFRITVH